ncbi:MAG: terminase family protein [Phycisphaerae bacterium]|nr:terminase family protein [Phycisphaerae bacterium]
MRDGQRGASAAAATLAPMPATVTQTPTMATQTPTATRPLAASSVPASVRALVPLLAYQREDVESAARFNWCCWSRQIGKSFTKSLRRLLRGLERGRNQVFLSAGERQSRELMLKTQQHCRALQIAAELHSHDWLAGVEFRHLEIRLPGDIRIIGLPANPQTVRGFTGDVFLDEFAMHQDDREIWAAVFPTILRGDGELDVASTPKGVGNLFASLRGNDRFRHSVVTLYDAVAQGLELDPEEIRLSMNDETLFRQEFLCEFLDEVNAFLTYELIACCEEDACSREIDWAALATRKHGVFVGVDVGRRRDLTVFWVLTTAGDALTTLGVLELRNEPFREQYALLQRLLAMRAVERCCIDATGIGMAMAEAAQDDFGSARVEAVMFSPGVKDRLATGLKRRMEDRTLRVPADRAIREDLHAVRWDATAGALGRFVVVPGGDSHADRFWALALAVRAADGGSVGPVEFRSVGTLRFARMGIW